MEFTEDGVRIDKPHNDFDRLVLQVSEILDEYYDNEKKCEGGAA